MLLRKISCLLLAGCTLLFAAAPEYIRLAGTVKDADGAAIENADVYLKSDDATKVQTDAEGKFLIEVGTSVIPHSFSVNKAVEIAGHGVHLNFSVSAPISKGLVTVSAGNGRRIKDIEMNNIATGMQSISLAGISNGFYIVQVTLDNFTTRRKLIAAGSEMIISEIKTKSSSMNSSLAKMAAAAEAVDTLVAEKDGFETAESAITAYEAEGIEIVLTEESSGPIECTPAQLPEPAALPENQKLPSPFTFFDGTEMTKKAEWPCRRQEILDMAYKYIYGPMPPFAAPDVEVTGTVSSNGVAAEISYNGKSATMNFSTSGSGDILLISMGSGLNPSGYSYRTLSVGGNSTIDGWASTAQSLTGVSTSRFCALGWGCNILCRAIASDPDGGIDTNKIMTTGCSATGKGAFFAGVFCEGIDLTLVVESGGFGGASFRMAEYLKFGPGSWQCGDEPQGIWKPDNGNFMGAPYTHQSTSSWVVGNNHGKIYQLPYDQHSLMACIAPRALCYVTNNNGPNSWCHLNGTGEALSAWAAEPVFDALGVPDNFGFRISDGAYGHCSGAQAEHGSLAKEFFKRVFDGDEAANTDVLHIPTGAVQQDPAVWEEVWAEEGMIGKTLE